MSKKITPDERNLILENPELVMFDPYSAIKTHQCTLGKALILPAVVGVLFFLWGFLFPEWINEHPKLFAGIGTAALIIASGTLPILYYLFDDHTFKKARAEHYSKQLKQLLPDDLECRIARIQWVVPEKAEGGWEMDGKEEVFGYCSYVNYFKIEPHTDLAVITDNNKFWAFIKRGNKTECFYQRDKKEEQNHEIRTWMAQP